MWQWQFFQKLRLGREQCLEEGMDLPGGGRF